MGVNIESADSSLRPASYTNAPLFEMELVMSVAAWTYVADVREKIGALCDEMNIDRRLTAV